MTLYMPWPCVRVSSRCSVETAERSKLVLAWKLLLTCPTLCYMEVLVPPKTRVGLLSFLSLPQTMDIENFASASRSSC